MAKKAKEPKPAAKKAPAAPPDPNKTKNLLRLLGTVALLLAIIAFLLQLFAVLTHNWKWQTTNLHGLTSPDYHYAQPNLYPDSRVDQKYGLYTRDVKVYGNKDEQLQALASTRFPRIDDDDEASYHQCLSHTSTLRGALLTCSGNIPSLDQCRCRRYSYWNWVIFFEIAALVLLGIVVFLTALIFTQFQALVKLIAAVLALLAFIFLLVGLILIASQLKRETRSLADAYPHIYQRISDKLGIGSYQNRFQRNSASELHKSLRRRSVVRRQTQDTYRLYPLLPGQYPYNATHYYVYSEQEGAWLARPYSFYPSSGYVPQPGSIIAPGSSGPGPKQSGGSYVPTQKSSTTVAPVLNAYGPAIGLDSVFDNTRAGLGPSTILSILALLPALLLPLLLIFSWLTGKKLQPSTKKEYVAVPQQEVAVQQTLLKQIPADYDPARPITDAIVTTQNVPPNFASGTTISTQPTTVTTVKQIPADYSLKNPTGDVYVTTYHPPGTFVQPQNVSLQSGVPVKQVPVDTYVAQNLRQGPYETYAIQPEVVVHDVIIPNEPRV